MAQMNQVQVQLQQQLLAQQQAAQVALHQRMLLGGNQVDASAALQNLVEMQKRAKALLMSNAQATATLGGGGGGEATMTTGGRVVAATHANSNGNSPGTRSMSSYGSRDNSTSSNSDTEVACELKEEPEQPIAVHT